VNVIMKFGGTSVADADAMTRVINIVRGHIARFPNHTLPIVVVSAMSKVTDRLVETGRLAGQGDADGAAALLRDLLARHIDVASGLVQGAALETMSTQLTQDFNALTEHVRGWAVRGEVAPQATDEILAMGELASSRMVAAAFIGQKIPAAGRFTESPRHGQRAYGGSARH
jgi:aspartate kinase